MTMFRSKKTTMAAAGAVGTPTASTKAAETISRTGTGAAAMTGAMTGTGETTGDVVGTRKTTDTAENATGAGARGPLAGTRASQATRSSSRRCRWMYRWKKSGNRCSDARPCRNILPLRSEYLPVEVCRYVSLSKKGIADQATGRRAFVQFSSVNDAIAFVDNNYPKLLLDFAGHADGDADGTINVYLHFARSRDDADTRSGTGQNWTCSVVS